MISKALLEIAFADQLKNCRLSSPKLDVCSQHPSWQAGSDHPIGSSQWHDLSLAIGAKKEPDYLDLAVK